MNRRHATGKAIIILLLFSQAVAAQTQRPQLFVQTGHVKTVRSLAFSNDGRILASASDDKTIRFWDVASGRELRRLKGNEFSVNAVAFSPDNKLLASEGDGVKLWDVATGQLISSSDRYATGDIVFSGDGRTLITANDTGVSIYDVATRKRLRYFHYVEARARTVSAAAHYVAFSRKDKTIRPLLLSESPSSAVVEIWDIETGKQSITFSASSFQVLAFSADEKTLATGGGKVTQLWDVATGSLLGELPASGSTSLAFSPDNRTLVSGNYEGLTFWDVATRQLLCSRENSGHLIKPIVFTKDGKTIASSGFEDATIKLWDADGRQIRILGGHDYAVSVSFNKQGMLLHRMIDDETMSIWDIAFGKNLRRFPWANKPASSLAYGSTLVSAVDYSGDGQLMARGDANDPIIIWNVVTGKKVRTLPGHLHGTYQLLFSPDNKTLASMATWSKEIKLWDVATGAELKRITPGQEYNWGMTFSADGTKLTLGSANKTVEVWDVATGQRLSTTKFPQLTGTYGGPLDSFSSYAFSPNGRLAAGAESYNNTVKLLDLATGKELRTLGTMYSADGHYNTASALLFSPDSSTLLTGAYDGSVTLWDVGSGRELMSFKGHTDAIRSLGFSADGKLLASVSADALIKLWDLATGKEVVSLIAADENDWLAVTPDGLFDGSTIAWNQILWRFSRELTDVAPVELFFNEFYYPDLLPEILSGKRPRAIQDIATKDRRQPHLEITSTNNASTSERNRTVKVAITEAPAGAQDVRLFRNGSLVKVWRGDVLRGQSGVTLETTVALVAGENRLTAYAFNHDNIKSVDAELSILGADTLKRVGTAYVLAIGVNAYANAAYNLRYAVADAEAFAVEFQRQQLKLGHYSKVEITSLVDTTATRANIVNALDKIRADIQPEDALVIYFAGHGTAQKNRFYLIPHDLGYDGSRTSLTREGLESILHHSISDLELEQAVEGVDAGTMLLVIDACNSGQALEADEKRRGPMNSKGLAQLAYEKGLYVLTAAQSYQAAQEAARLGHGFLTYALVEEGLKSNSADRAPRDGQVLLREWLDFASARVPEMQLEEFAEQRKEGRQLLQLIDFAENDKAADRQLQRPRVFYRREAETLPFVVARP